MFERSHGFSMQLCGNESSIYESTQLMNLIGNEIPPWAQKERFDILKTFRQITQLMDDKWKTIVSINSNNQSYDESLVYVYADSEHLELGIRVFYGKREFDDNPYIPSNKEELFKDMGFFINARKEMIDELLVKHYEKTCLKLLDRFDDYCKVYRASHPMLHSFLVTPQYGSKNTIGIQVSISPKMKARLPTSQSTLQ